MWSRYTASFSAGLAVAACFFFGVTGTVSAGPVNYTNYATVYAAGGTAPSDYNPMSGYGLFSTKSASKDYVGSLYTYSADAAVYAGGGIEPMAFTQVDAQGTGTMSTYAQAEVQWSHWIDPLPGAPAVDYIPAILDFRVGQDESNGIAYAWLSAKTCWGGYIGCADPNISRTWEAKAGSLISTQWSSWSRKFETVDYVDHFSVPIQMVPGTEAVIYLKAKSTVNLTTAGANPITSSYAQSIIDPLLMVDPDWEYASFFQVVQRKSLTDGTGIEVTRDWMPTTVPEPASAALMMAAVPILGWACRRRHAVDRQLA